MKKVRVRWLVFVTMILIVLAIIIYMFYLPWARLNGTYVYYDGLLYSSNENYNGIINLSDKRVSILNQSQKEVSGIDIKECIPDQIVLGEKTYFLLYRQNNKNEDARIVQYDYHSVKKQEYMAQNTAVIDYKDGYLFMGNRDGEDTSRFTFGDYALYANNYIKEEEFGQQPEQLKQADAGNCMVGNMELYYHEDGYFSSEPALGDYPGLSRRIFRASDKNYQAESKQEKRNRSMLLSKIENVSNAVYEVFEYQIENEIYGLCKVFEQGAYIPSLPCESRDIKASYFYKINPKEDEIKILLKKESCIGLILSNNEAVYQENNRIMHHDFQTGDVKEIYQINNGHYLQLYINRGYLMVAEEKKRVLPSVFPTDEKVNSVIKWKLRL